MRIFLKWLVIAPIAIVLVFLAFLNRRSVPVTLDPLGNDIPYLSFEAPLFLVMLVCGALGVMTGSLFTWLGQSKHRRAARTARAEADRARDETQRLRAQAAGNLTALAPPSRNAA